MKLAKDLEISGLALRYKDCLILADLHIGIEESLNKQGLLIPRFQFKEIKAALEKILTKKFSKIIINGDLKHEFGTISKQEWRNTLQILDLFSKYCKKIILIKGNHDTILGPIAEKKNIKILDSYKLDNILITHGHKIIKEKSPVIIIGHEHPAVSFKERPNETFKCFLKGKYKNSALIVQPSFNFVTTGSNITQEQLLSPYLEEINSFEVFVVEDKIYNFGKLKYLLQH